MLTRLLRTYLAPYRRPITGLLILSLAGTMAALLLPSLNAAIIDEGVARGDIAFIWRTGQMMLAVSLVQVGCSIWATYLGAKTAMSFGRDVRASLFERVLSFSSRELNHFGAPSLITRNTNDVQQVQLLVLLSSTMFVAAPITMIGGIFMALRTDIGLSWLVAVAMPVLAISIFLVIRKMRPLFRLMQTQIDTVNRVLREQITGRFADRGAAFPAGAADLQGQGRDAQSRSRTSPPIGPRLARDGERPPGSGRTLDAAAVGDRARGRGGRRSFRSCSRARGQRSSPSGTAADLHAERRRRPRRRSRTRRHRSSTGRSTQPSARVARRPRGSRHRRTGRTCPRVSLAARWPLPATCRTAAR